MSSGFADRPRAVFLIQPAAGGKWRWMLRAADRRSVTLAADSRSYDTQQECWEAIQRVQDEACRADIEPYETLTAE